MAKTPEKPSAAERQAEAAAALRPHLSALVDGELEPLEAIAVQTHVRQSAELAAEVRELERLKLAVHLAGTRDKAPEVLKTRLAAACRATFVEKAEAERRRLWRWVVPAGGLVAAAVAVIVVAGGDAPRTDRGAELASMKGGVMAPVRVDAGNEVIAKLVDVHRGDASMMELADMQEAGILTTLERVPDGLVEGGRRVKLVQASSMGCNERDGGSTLAVLDASRVELPQPIANVLEMNGVYLDTIDGVDVRLSTSGGKVFVILSGDGRSTSADPI